MTQEYTPTGSDIKSSYIEGSIGDGSVTNQDDDRLEASADFDRWLAAHDAQIRAEALGFANAEQIDNGEELLNESLYEAVKEYLLYGAHPLSTEDNSDDIWDDCDLFNLRLTNGDVIDCSELADEVLDALKRYLSGQPILQSIPVKEQKQ
jgi:hypothetical protein